MGLIQKWRYTRGNFYGTGCVACDLNAIFTKSHLEKAYCKFLLFHSTGRKVSIKHTWTQTIHNNRLSLISYTNWPNSASSKAFNTILNLDNWVTWSESMDFLTRVLHVHVPAKKIQLQQHLQILYVIYNIRWFRVNAANI